MSYFQNDSLNLWVETADLQPDPHKQTLLGFFFFLIFFFSFFFNKKSLPKTTPRVPMQLRGKYGFNRNTVSESGRKGEKREEMENQIYVPLLTASRCVQKQKIYSNRSGRAGLRQRDWVVHYSRSSGEP